MKHKFYYKIYYMKRALKLAKKGLFTTGSNPCVGCVLVKNGTIIGEAYHQFKGEAHAEVLALNQAGELAKGCTAYVTLEPCSHYGANPPCADALIKAQVKRVVICNSDPNPLVNGQGVQKLKQAGIEVEEAVLESKGFQLNCGFLTRMQTGLPFVRLKMAQSLDGRTAMQNGDSYWITGEKARSDVQYWRARSQAIVTGVETVLQDDCRLTVRVPSLPKKHQKLPHVFDKQQPMRVVLDSNLRIPVDAKILQNNARRVIFTHDDSSNQDKSQKIKQLKEQGVEVICLKPSAQNRRIDLQALLKWLAQEQVNELLVETGATLAGEFIRQKLVQQLIVYTAPVIMGSSARPLFQLDIEEMQSRLHIDDFTIKRLGKDWRLLANL